MGKTCIEVCLISARGLKRTPSFFKLHWFAVAWIDPSNKYCTRVDSSSSNGNPIWKTKFLTSLDQLNSPQDLAVHVEVYRRDPIFLRQTLFGTATILLKEFLDKYYACSSSNPPEVEEVGSFQLRRKGGGSNKPRGFVDVSIRIRDGEAPPCSSSYNAGVDEVFDVMHLRNGSSNLFHMPLNNNIGYDHSSFPVPSSIARGGQQRVHGPAFGLGLGVGALAAGSGFFGSGLQEDAAATTARLTTMSTDYPF